MSEPQMTKQLADLAAMSPGQLLIEWRRHFRSAPPQLSKDLMIRFVAWQLQVKAAGALPRKIGKLLDALAAGGEPTRRVSPKFKPGTRIVREWNGRLLCVHVTKDGFSFEDRSYRSLSQIAREVTGAHWSGPRFFGLRQEKKRAA